MEGFDLKKGWIFTDIDGIREANDEEPSTYYLFDYDELPPIEMELDDDFNWLKPYPQYLSEEDWEYDFKEELKSLQAEALSKGLLMPKSFLTLMNQADLLRRIRSNTDCYFELGNVIEEIPETNGLYFIHFLSDSQYCSFWYLCLDKKGNHCVVVSGNLYGHEAEDFEEFRDLYDEVGYFCSPSFKEFIARFWLENEICFKTYDDEELNEIENRYAQYYQDRK